MKKHIFTVIILLLVVAAGAIFWQVRENEQLEAQQRQKITLAYEQESRQLYNERGQLEDELAAVNAMDPEAGLNLGSLIIMFAEPDAHIMTDVLPKMNEYGYKGMIAVSNSYFPGDEGCLTAADMQSLVSAGWELALSVTDGDDLLVLLQRVQSLGLTTTGYVYIADGTAAVDWQTRLSALGLKTLVYRDAVPEKTGDLWLIEAKGSNDTGSSAKLTACAESSICLIMTVGFQNSYEMYTEKNFNNMLAAIHKFEDAGQLVVANSQTARARLQARQEAVAANEATIRQRQEELNAALDVNMQQIEAVNQKYSNLMRNPQ